MWAVAWRHFEVLRDPTEVTLRKDGTLLHECFVHLPESIGRLGGIFGKFGGARCELVVGDGHVPKHILHAFPESIPELLDDIVNGAAPKACITAVLDQDEIAIGRT
jgi:hypothetical protein